MSRNDSDQTAKTKIPLDERTTVQTSTASTLNDAFDARTVVIKKPMAPPPTGLETTDSPAHRRAARKASDSRQNTSNTLADIKAALAGVPPWAFFAIVGALFLFALTSSISSTPESNETPNTQAELASVAQTEASQQNQAAPRAPSQPQSTLTEVLAQFDQSYTRTQTELRKRQDQR